MKKIIAVLCLAAALMISACGPAPVNVSPSPSVSASPSAAPSPSVSTPAAPSPSVTVPVITVGDYFPFTPNVIMTYLGSGNEFAGFVSHVDYINNGAIQLRTNNGGTESVGVYKIDSGALKKVFSQGETYYMYDYTAQNVMSDILIMEPLAVGTTWTLGSGDQRSITGTNVTVVVPHGTYQALEVTTTYTDSVVKEYYAINVGLVKREFTSNSDPTNPITSALQTITTGAPYNQTLRFYYPDFNNDRTAYVEKSLEFYTDDTLAAKFETEFKSVPAGSGLTPLMSQDTKINSLTFDMATGVAAVDFSKEFITKMNAGTSLEGMLLDSVANTLGGYFQTNKVQISIDGGPYESGHFLFKTGEYLNYEPSSAVAYNP